MGSINGFFIDFDAASQPAIGQHPTSIIRRNTDDTIKSVRIVAPFGRFGNNFIQAANALLICKQLGILNAEFCLFGERQPVSFDVHGIKVSCQHAFPESASAVIQGSFYAPYGFESLFVELAQSEVDPILRALANFLNPHDTAKSASSESVLAVHFRSGDIFSLTSPVSPSYVQPPYAYYVRAIKDACESNKFSRIDLIYEDRLNPAIAMVEKYLQELNVNFISQSSTLQDDIQRMMTADCIISSVSTFSETIALMSRKIKRYYSFREHSSQSEFHPFLQSKTADILKYRGVRCKLIDDMTKTYTAKWQWVNSEGQRDFIRRFTETNLRIYEG